MTKKKREGENPSTNRDWKASLIQIRNLVQNSHALLLTGLNNVERRMMAMWNTWNVMVRMFEEVGIEQGWWKDREEYQARFTRIGEELYKEAAEHEAAERERIRNEQASGAEPQPMKPGPNPMGDLVKLLKHQAGENEKAEDKDN